MFDLAHQIEWRPGIGDPSFIGWLTVALYFFSALCCIRVYIKSSVWFHSDIERQARFWLVLSAVLLMLGLNKQLDLQSLLTDMGRVLARQQGWYEERRSVQKIFILGVFSVGAFIAIFLFIYLRQALKANIFAVIGIVCLISFIVIRASSFHKVDMLLGARILGIKFNWIMEISGIGLIIFNALFARKSDSQE